MFLTLPNGEPFPRIVLMQLNNQSLFSSQTKRFCISTFLCFYQQSQRHWNMCSYRGRSRLIALTVPAIETYGKKKKSKSSLLIDSEIKSLLEWETRKCEKGHYFLLWMSTFTRMILKKNDIRCNYFVHSVKKGPLPAHLGHCSTAILEKFPFIPLK